jgi:hypothetical protein
MKTVLKTLQRSNDHYIQFTEEEMECLQIKPGDKFSYKVNSDGTVSMEKFVPVELDIESWDKEVLLFLLEESITKDLTINEVINDVLTKSLETKLSIED